MSNAVMGTGLSGLVGSRLVDMYSGKYTFENFDLTTGIDITKEDIVEKAVAKSDANVLVHFAAFTDVNKAHEQTDNTQGLCYQVNVLGTKNIASACKKHNKYLIHVSTDFVFDGTKDEPVTETDKPNPIEWYGKTKLLAEEEVIQSGCMYSIIRLAYPYRASHPVRVDIVRNILKRLKEGTMYPPFTDHTITPTFIDDIANIVDILIQSKPENQIYHAVGSSWHTDYEITKLIQEVFGLSGEIQQGSLEKYLASNPRPYQKTQKISNQKVIDQLKYTPKTLKEGLLEIKSQKEVLESTK